MNKTLLISEASSLFSSARLSLVANQEALEFRVPFETSRNSLFLGVITNTHKNLGFSFVNIGEKLPALLPLPPSFWKKPPFHVGEKILVQITRDKIPQNSESCAEEKGLRLTTDLSFLSPFFMYFPQRSGLRFSKKYPRHFFSETLISDILKFLPENQGLLLRPLAQEASLETLRTTFMEFLSLFESLKSQKTFSQDPGILLRAPNYIEQYILEQCDTLKTIVVDTSSLFSSLTQFLKRQGLSSFIQLQHHLPLTKGDLFEAYDVQEKWETQKDPVIPLSPSGHLILEKTSAFWTFDVNSSSLGALNTPPLSPFDLNKAAGLKVLSEMRLKNLGGTILIDLIPMPSEALRKKLLKVLQEKAWEDSLQTHVHHISPLGLCEITRPRKDPSLLDFL